MTQKSLKQKGSQFWEEFNDNLRNLEKKLDETEIAQINPDELRRVARYIDQMKPLSKMKKHKVNLIEYLKRLQNLKEQEKFNKTNLTLAKQGSLENVLTFLNGSHKFYTGKLAIHSEAIIGLVVDIVLALTGIAEYYYYVPVFMLIMLFLGIRKHRRLKKEGKILDL